MTKEEFLSEFFMEARGTRHWFFKSGLYGSGMIRYFDPVLEHEFCPITYLFYKKYKKALTPFSAENAGKKIGMSLKDTWTIILTADLNKNYTTCEAVFDKDLRKELETLVRE